MIIQSKKVWVLGNWLEAQVEVEDGKITAILPYGEKTPDEDYGEKRVVPGFIDIHTHGAYGFDTNDANEEGLRKWMKNIPQEGVTGILPTTITQSEEVLTKAVANVAKVVDEGYEGAEILNGDRAGLRQIEGKWTAFGLPLAGSSFIYRNESALLEGIVVLRQAGKNRIRRLKPVEAFRYLYPETTVHQWHRPSAEKAVSLLMDLISQVPVFLLECRPDEEAVRLLKETIVGLPTEGE